MINGIMTLSGAWHKLRDDPILKFLIVSLSFYGMSHVRGPDDVDQDGERALALHRLDHRPRALGRARLGRASSRWAALYYLIPRLFGRTEMYSVKAITLHFWIATIGIVLYIAAMWIAGVMQGLMWRAMNADGTLTYSFVESVKATYPVLRDPPVRRRCSTSSGMLIMAWNVVEDAAPPAAPRTRRIPDGGRPCLSPAAEPYHEKPT